MAQRGNKRLVLKKIRTSVYEGNYDEYHVVIYLPFRMYGMGEWRWRLTGGRFKTNVLLSKFGCETKTEAIKEAISEIENPTIQIKSQQMDIYDFKTQR